MFSPQQRCLYSLLLIIRLFFVFQTSYIHPDEHFQGPEVIAGQILDWNYEKTWEFTSARPIRSFLPLWALYGIPIKIAASLGVSSPMTVYYALRLFFLVLSVVLGDLAVYLLSHKKGKAVLLVAGSYTTWVHQTHTFSNSAESILVLWTIVLIEKIRASKGSITGASALLGCIIAFGTFNRITFPAFIVLPGLTVSLTLLKRPLTLIYLVLATAGMAVLAISADTSFYKSANLVITPLNNLLYNTQTSNLAQHGLHPRITHLAVNLPQLLGPAIIPLIVAYPKIWFKLSMLSAASGIAILSIMPHQEARFLLPCVPLVLSQMTLPRSKVWLAAWMGFNAVMGILMGAYHQAGIVPAQAFLSQRTDASAILHWRTYSPPTWLLGPNKAPCVKVPSSIDERGQRAALDAHCSQSLEGTLYFMAPLSAPLLHDARLQKIWTTRWHINLDDLDIGEDGLGATIERVIGKRGLGVWEVACNSTITV